MNKDAILATIIGFGVGLVIAALVFLGPTMFKNLPQFKLPDMSFLTQWLEKKPSSKNPAPTPATSDTLVIESPLPESIEPKNETLVSGSTRANATVVIESTDTETVVIANDNGAYAGRLTLAEGKNDIIVTSYKDRDIQTQSVTVYYTPEEF